MRGHQPLTFMSVRWPEFAPTGHKYC
jgi:hypothetical protein